MKRSLFGALLLLPLAVHASVQARTDFSGRWTTEPATSGGSGVAGATGRAGAGRAGGARGRGPVAGDMGSGWGPTITIAQTGGQLTVEYAFFARGDMQPPLRFVYALDGSETKNSVMMGRGVQYQVSKTAWDGAKLVITTQHTFAGPDDKPMTEVVTQALSLDSPTSLVVEAVRAGVLGGPTTSTRTVYRKIS